MHAIRITMIVFFGLFSVRALWRWLLLGDKSATWPQPGMTERETAVAMLIDGAIAVWLGYLIFKH